MDILTEPVGNAVGFVRYHSLMLDEDKLGDGFSLHD